MKSLMTIALTTLNTIRCGHSLSLIILVGILFGITNQAYNQSVKDSASFFFNKARLYSFRGVYDSSIAYFQDASRLFLKEGIKTKSLESRIMIVDVLNQKGAFKEAKADLAILEEVIEDDHQENTLLRSELMKVIGNHYLLTGNPDSAHLFLQQALALRREQNNEEDSSFAYIFGKLAFVAYMLGDYDSALLLYNKALKLGENKESSENYEISAYYQGMGIVLTKKGEYDKAESHFLKSLEISRKYFKENDLSLAKLYLNLGRFYYSISKIDEAYKFYLKCQNIFETSLEKDNINLGLIYWNIGTYYIINGDYGKSIYYLNKAKYILSRHLPEDHQIIKDLYMDIGLAFKKKQDFDNAIKYYKLSIVKNNTPSVIRSYRNLANAYTLREDYDSAETNYIHSIDAAKTFSVENTRDLALSYRNYGKFLLESMDNEEGLTYYDRSLSILQDILRPDHEDIARAYLLYGEYYYSESKFNRALSYIDKAFQVMGINSNDYDSFNQSFGEELGLFVMEALKDRSNIMLGLFRQTGERKYLEECLAITNASVEQINALRMSYSTEESKLQLMSRAKSSLNTGIMASYLLYEETGEIHYARQVYELGERSKSIVLLNSLRGLEAMKLAKIPDEVGDLENQLKRDLYSYNSLIYKEEQKNERNRSKILLWQSMAFDIKKRYDSLVNSLERNYVSFYQLKYDNSIVSLDSVMLKLQPDQAIIEFTLTDTNFYISLITSETFECFCVADGQESLSTAITDYKNLFKENTMGNFTSDDYLTYIKTANYIYRKLLAPLEQYIGGKKLIIIPDAELGYLSFDALIKEMPDTAGIDYRSLNYLLYSYAISYSASATILYGLEKDHKSAINKKLLAFAPSYSSEEAGSTLRSSEPGIDSLRLLPIKGVEQEVKKIMQIFRGRKFSGNRATEYNFKVNASNYSVLHLAMHTILDDENPLFSKMVFTSGGDESEDGLLNTYELFSMDLKGRLCVLSACNTGSGKLQRGEGIMSLARGFIYAGIPSLVMTLWEIDDQSSSEIMTSFYKNLDEELPTDIALQQAKVNYILGSDKFQSHPTYWAGFVNIGESSPIPVGNSTPWYIWILGIIIFCLVLFFINRQVYLWKKSD